MLHARGHSIITGSGLGRREALPSSFPHTLSPGNDGCVATQGRSCFWQDHEVRTSADKKQTYGRPSQSVWIPICLTDCLETRVPSNRGADWAQARLWQTLNIVAHLIPQPPGEPALLSPFHT